MWPFGRRTPYVDHYQKPSPTEILADLPDDTARALQCHKWAVETRAKLFQGQQESIQDVLDSKELRYQRMGTRERTAAGSQKWATTQIAVDLLKTEEMFSRWARGYAANVRLKDLNPKLKSRSF